MGYLTLDLECSECLRDLEFTQNKQVLTVKPCICRIQNGELHERLITAYTQKTTI